MRERLGRLGKDGHRAAMVRLSLIEVVLPLVAFYGLRAVGVSQLVALIVAAALPAVRVIHGIVTRRRVSGVALLVLTGMVLAVVMSSITGSPRVLLVREAWATGAMGLWILGTLVVGRPFLYAATRLFLDDAGQRAWSANWEQFEEFRHALRVCTATWGGAFTTYTAVRVLLALTLPIDLVPVLGDALLVVIVLVPLGVQKRWYGTNYLRRHGLTRRGVELYREHGRADALGAGS